MSNSMSEPAAGFVGGIDLGGTKIETTLFAADMSVINTRRSDTPRDDYDLLVQALTNEITHLRAQSGQPDLPVGIGIPGLVDPKTGLAQTANLPATGRSLQADILNGAPGRIMVENDCKCFALSEALGGSGDGYGTVFGLILGTGIGGGMVRKKVLDDGPNRIAGEVGHIGLPADILARHDLPVLKCGCRREGCYETLASGRGMTELSRILTGHAFTARDLQENATVDQHEAVLEVWSDILAELLLTIVLTVDPDCIVLGGGLSRIDRVAERLTSALQRIALPTLRLPDILQPKFGDSSGTRGAALLVRQMSETQR